MSEKSQKVASLEGELSSVTSRLAVLRSFFEHPGWQEFMQVTNEQIEGRKGTVLLQPLESADKIYLQEFTKGEISGLLLSQVSLAARFEQLKNETKVLEANLEKENELEKMVADERSRSRVDDKRWHGGDSDPGSGG